MKKCPDCLYGHDAPTERCDNCHAAWRGYKEIDYTTFHKWVKENDCAGTIFGPGDVESIWQMEWEEELGIPFKDVWSEMRHSYEWKHMVDLLCEHGFEIISQMWEDYVREKGLRK